MATKLTDGRPWVLLPGTLCTGAVFDGFLDALGVPDSARRVVDMRYPHVEDYLKILTSMCTPDAVVCGFSLGSIVAAHHADQLPASTFFLFGLTPYADDPVKREGRLALAQEVHLNGGAAAFAPSLLPFAGSDPMSVREKVLAMAEEGACFIDAQTELALSRPGALEPLAATNVPVTLITGTQDTFTPMAGAQSVVDVMPKGRLVALHGLGHYALLEDPEACYLAVKGLL